jgi:hypothetical protein
MVRYTVKPGREHENAALVRAVFDELAQTQPDGFRYAVFQLPDTRQFLHLYTDEGATSGALQQLPSFQAFVAAAEDRHEQPATFTTPELIGDYRHSTTATVRRPSASPPPPPPTRRATPGGPRQTGRKEPP